MVLKNWVIPTRHMLSGLRKIKSTEVSHERKCWGTNSQGSRQPSRMLTQTVGKVTFAYQCSHHQPHCWLSIIKWQCSSMVYLLIKWHLFPSTSVVYNLFIINTLRCLIKPDRSCPDIREGCTHQLVCHSYWEEFHVYIFQSKHQRCEWMF